MTCVISNKNKALFYKYINYELGVKIDNKSFTTMEDLVKELYFEIKSKSTDPSTADAYLLLMPGMIVDNFTSVVKYNEYLINNDLPVLDYFKLVNKIKKTTDVDGINEIKKLINIVQEKPSQEKLDEISNQAIEENKKQEAEKTSPPPPPPSTLIENDYVEDKNGKMFLPSTLLTDKVQEAISHNPKEAGYNVKDPNKEKAFTIKRAVIKKVKGGAKYFLKPVLEVDGVIQLELQDENGNTRFNDNGEPDINGDYVTYSLERLSPDYVNYREKHLAQKLNNSKQAAEIINSENEIIDEIFNNVGNEFYVPITDGSLGFIETSSDKSAHITPEMDVEKIYIIKKDNLENNPGTKEGDVVLRLENRNMPYVLHVSPYNDPVMQDELNLLKALLTQKDLVFDGVPLNDVKRLEVLSGLIAIQNLGFTFETGKDGRRVAYIGNKDVSITEYFSTGDNLDLFLNSPLVTNYKNPVPYRSKEPLHFHFGTAIKNHHRLEGNNVYTIPNGYNDYAKKMLRHNFVLSEEGEPNVLNAYFKFDKGFTKSKPVVTTAGTMTQTTPYGTTVGEPIQTSTKSLETKGDVVSITLKGIPNFTIDKTLSNKDGSKRFASTNGTVIKINPVNNTEEFFEYLKGNGGESSKQKEKVLQRLIEKGYTLEKIQVLLNDVTKINTFLVLHEQDHIDNNDKDVYFKNGKDLLTDDKIDIEVRATINALDKIESMLKPVEQESASTEETKEIKPIQQEIKEESVTSISDIFTDTGISIADLGISQEEWDSLLEEEKESFKKCN